MRPFHRPLSVTSALAAVVLSSSSFAQVPTLVDIVAGGGPPLDGAREGAISPDGRWVAFTSTAADLVPNDTNGDTDVFLRDRASSTILRVSVSTGGGESHPVPAAQATYNTTFVSRPAVSSGGRFVVFASSAPDLVANDTNGLVDVFVHDVVAGTTERVSVGAGGVEANGESGLAYVLSSGFGGPFTYTVPTGVAISPDGRYVAFGSQASNLTAGGNTAQAIYLRDRQLGTNEVISVNAAGAGTGPSWFPSLSSDSRYVAFESMATDLVAGDTNLATDVFLRDRTAGTTARVSVDSGGIEGNAPSGFNLFDPPFCGDCGIQNIELGSQISADGTVVVFGSEATNFASVTGTTFEPPRNVFRHVVLTGVTTLVSATSTGTGGNAPSMNPSVSANGRYTAYETAADDIVTVPLQSGIRILVHDNTSGTTSVASVDATGAIPAFDSATAPTMSDDGGRIAFTDFSDLHTADTNQTVDVYAGGPVVVTFTDACEGSVATCPCGNVGGPGAGCANSAQPLGTRIDAIGLPSVSQDSIVLLATRLVPNTVVLFGQSTTAPPTATAPVFGDGARCLTGVIRRLRTLNASGDTAQLGQTGPHISALGQIPPAGGTRYYAAIYRNAAPYCGASTFNMSNSIQINWIP